MTKPVELSSTDKDFLGQVARFAERNASQGVMLHMVHSATLNAPVLVLVAIGDQAAAVQKIMLDKAVPESSLIERPGQNNGGW